MADPFDFSQLGIPTPQAPPAAPDPRITNAGPASGIPQGMQPSAPQDENELAERVGGWERFLSTIAGDPNLQQSLISFGSTAMQPRIGGQTQAGQIGKALQAGADTYVSNRREDTQEGFRDRQITSQESNAATYARTGESQAAATDASVERQAQTLPTELALVREQIRAARLQNDPERQELMLDQMFQDIQRSAADTAYLQARTKYIPDEVAARYVTASRPASAVQVAQAYAGTLVATGVVEDEDAAMQIALEKFNDRRETPEQFRANLMGDLQRAGLLGDQAAIQAIEAATAGYSQRYGALGGVPAPQAAPDQSGAVVKQYATEAEALEAASREELKAGDTVRIGNQTMTYNP